MVRDFLIGRALPIVGRVYTNRVQPLANGLGIEPPLRTAYENAVDALLPSTKTLTVNGIEAEFHISNQFEYSHFEDYRSQPDYHVLRDVLTRLERDDVFWDIGANIGIYTCFTAALSKRIIAIEPHPKNAARIRENVAINDREAVVRQWALSTDSGSVNLKLNSPDVPGAFGSTGDLGTEKTISVKQRRGDELIGNELPRPSVLKVDVQGVEADVLQGLGAALDDCRHVYCNIYEKHHDTSDDTREVPNILEQKGFTIHHLQQWNGGYFIRADAR